MNHQAQRKQNLELWEIVTLPPKPKAQSRRKTCANAQAIRRRKARQRKVRICRSIAVASLFALCVVLLFTVRFFYQNLKEEMRAKGDAQEQGELSVFLENLMEDSTVKKPEIQQDFLSISEYNRPGTKLASVKNIFVHYTANPKTTAAQNRSYFEGLGQTHERAASAHFIIGCEGEVIQCIPLNEEAYAVIGRNNDSISIECCYISEDGAFTQETYDSLIHMLAWLIDEYDLETQDILRHYDCGEKLCPLYYVEHEDAWEKLLYDVEHYAAR